MASGRAIQTGFAAKGDFMLRISNGLWRCAMIIVGILGLVGTGGCATILGGGGEQNVRVNSSPSGAAVKVDGKDYGKTPAVVRLSRKENHVVRLELAGYQPTETKLEKQLNPWVFGNILFGGLIGLAVDIGTGGVNELKPGAVESTFGANTASGPTDMPVGLNVNFRPSSGGE
jgi:hypothetical protein